MVVIRFQRRGKKHQPSFRIVADNKRSKLDGANLEDLGWYNPHSKECELKTDRVQYWLSVGAKPSNTVYNLLVTKGVVEGKKISVHKNSKKTKEEDPAEEKKPEATETEAPVEEAKEEASAEPEQAPAEEKKEETVKEDSASEENLEEEKPSDAEAMEGKPE